MITKEQYEEYVLLEQQAKQTKLEDAAKLINEYALSLGYLLVGVPVQKQANNEWGIPRIIVDADWGIIECRK